MLFLVAEDLVAFFTGLFFFETDNFYKSQSEFLIRSFLNYSHPKYVPIHYSILSEISVTVCLYVSNNFFANNSSCFTIASRVLSKRKETDSSIF